MIAKNPRGRLVQVPDRNFDSIATQLVSCAPTSNCPGDPHSPSKPKMSSKRALAHAGTGPAKSTGSCWRHDPSDCRLVTPPAIVDARTERSNDTNSRMSNDASEAAGCENFHALNRVPP